MKNYIYNQTKLPMSLFLEVLEYDYDKDIKKGGYKAKQSKVCQLTLELLEELIKLPPSRTLIDEDRAYLKVLNNTSINFTQDELDLALDNKVLTRHLIVNKPSSLPTTL